MKAWIARDPEGGCFVFLEEPTLIKEENDGETYAYWYSEEPPLFDTQMPDTFHPEVTFDNSPQPLEFTPEDGIAMLDRIRDLISERFDGSQMLMIDMCYMMGKEHMITHTLSMLELLKDSNK